MTAIKQPALTARWCASRLDLPPRRLARQTRAKHRPLHGARHHRKENPLPLHDRPDLLIHAIMAGGHPRRHRRHLLPSQPRPRSLPGRPARQHLVRSRHGLVRKHLLYNLLLKQRLPPTSNRVQQPGTSHLNRIRLVISTSVWAVGRMSSRPQQRLLLAHRHLLCFHRQASCITGQFSNRFLFAPGCANGSAPASCTVEGRELWLVLFRVLLWPLPAGQAVFQ